MDAHPDIPTSHGELASRIACIARSPLFNDLQGQSRALEHLAVRMHERAFLKDDLILQEGEKGDEIFLLIEGRVSIFKHTAEGIPYKVATLEANLLPAFGEGAMLDAEPRSATISAEGHAKCLVLARADFEQFCELHPAEGLHLVRKIAIQVHQRLKRTNDDLLMVYRALIAEIRGQ